MDKQDIVLKKLVEMGDKGVTYLDFVNDGITENELDGIIQMLSYGIYKTPYDNLIKFDA